jgi:hypothetical protein
VADVTALIKASTSFMEINTRRFGLDQRGSSGSPGRPADCRRRSAAFIATLPGPWVVTRRTGDHQS